VDDPKQVKEPGAAYSAPVTDLSHPIIIQRGGQPVAALISIEEYERYQAAMREQREISASEARRLADRVVFRDLVGCALSSGDPIWASTPKPHWRVPYRSFEGTLLTEVDVDARTRAVSLTSEERESLLTQIEQLTAAGHVSA
jgi:PHD/YefM family antitoxin component YafN of YafNO toxin-antitoxin module